MLVLLGFAATDFVITKTLSAADAAVHLIDNPYWKEWTARLARVAWLVCREPTVVRDDVPARVPGRHVPARVSRGDRRWPWSSSSVYLVLNVIVVGSGLVYLLAHGDLLSNWVAELQAGDWHAVEHLPLVEAMPLADRDLGRWSSSVC